MHGRTALLNALSTQADLAEAVEDVQMRLQKMAEEKGEPIQLDVDIAKVELRLMFDFEAVIHFLFLVLDLLI